MKILLKVSLWIFLSILNGSSTNIISNSLLFCLNPSVDDLVINDSKNQTNNDQLNLLLKKYNIFSIDKWLIHARPNERDKDIYLDKIYRIIMKNNDVVIISQIISELKKINIVHSV